MSSNYIACIDQQNDSVYWIGTIGGGVNKLTIHSQQNNDYSATCYTNNDGLTSNDSEIIYIDKNKISGLEEKVLLAYKPRQTVSMYTALMMTYKITRLK